MSYMNYPAHGHGHGHMHGNYTFERHVMDSSKHAHQTYSSNSLISTQCCPNPPVSNFHTLLPYAHLKIDSSIRADGLGWWKFTLLRTCRGCGVAGKPVCERVDGLGTPLKEEYEKRLEAQLFDNAHLTDMLAHGIDLTVNTHLFNLSPEHCRSLRSARTFEEVKATIQRGITWLGVANSAQSRGGLQGIKKMEYTQTLRYLLICKLILVCQNQNMGGAVFWRTGGGGEDLAGRFGEWCYSFLRNFDRVWDFGGM